ncbi:MAG: hypothetical protein ABF260_07740 [Flavobacteriaceae bacterium]
MKKLFLIIGTILFISSCEKNDDEMNYPTCLQTRIDNFIENYGVQNSPSNIKKYEYLSQTVYIFSGNNISDEQFSVIDKNCNTICSFGSIAGNNNCDNWESAEFIETVWIDNR